MATVKDTADSAARLDPIPLNNLPAGPHGHCAAACFQARTAV
jgi:hypothetical protein